MNDSDQKMTLTVTEAAELLGISRGLAYELVRRDEIPNIKVGRRILVPRHGLELLLGQLRAPRSDDEQQQPADLGSPGPQLRTAPGPVTAYLCIPVTLDGWSPPTIDIH